MNRQHKAIRTALTSMAPKRAIAYIRAFELPEEEEACLIERDVLQKSRLQIALRLHVSVETVDERRRSAYKKIADGISHQ